jgi:hypothetical protein
MKYIYLVPNDQVASNVLVLPITRYKLTFIDCLNRALYGYIKPKVGEDEYFLGTFPGSSYTVLGKKR